MECFGRSGVELTSFLAALLFFAVGCQSSRFTKSTVESMQAIENSSGSERGQKLSNVFYNLVGEEIFKRTQTKVPVYEVTAIAPNEKLEFREIVEVMGQPDKLEGSLDGGQAIYFGRTRSHPDKESDDMYINLIFWLDNGNIYTITYHMTFNVPMSQSRPK